MVLENMWTYLVVGALIIMFMAIYLGNVRRFYDKFAWWDILIHCLSGILFMSFGVAISSGVNGLSRFNILFFSLTLSIALHVVWEIAEYVLDCATHGNNQRWQKEHHAIDHTPKNAIQPAGLIDTMNDTLSCITGALTACGAWWFVL